jgi:hypothetical protein
MYAHNQSPSFSQSTKCRGDLPTWESSFKLLEATVHMSIQVKLLWDFLRKVHMVQLVDNKHENPYCVLSTLFMPLSNFNTFNTISKTHIILRPFCFKHPNVTYTLATHTHTPFILFRSWLIAYMLQRQFTNMNTLKWFPNCTWVVDEHVHFTNHASVRIDYMIVEEPFVYFKVMSRT